ncbi:Halomucin [Bienertia sinuspersici]
MEGVEAHLGRPSSRYETTTVFNGPVRKWKKDWVLINPSSSSSSNNSNHHHNNHHHHSSSNGSVNGSNGSSVSHLRLYKWTPLNKDNSNSNDNSNKKFSRSNNNITNSHNNDDGVANGGKDSSNDDSSSEEPPRRKFKYIRIIFSPLFFLFYFLPCLHLLLYWV